MSKEIFVITEYKKDENTFRIGTFELLSAAKSLADEAIKFGEVVKISAVVMDGGFDTDFSPLFKFGANKVIYLKNPHFRNFNLDSYTLGLIKLFETKCPDIVLFSSTLNGRELAPSITSRLKTGLTADCTELHFVNSKGEIKLAATRPTFGGALMATILCKTKPECATVREGAIQAIECNLPYGEVEEFNLGYDFSPNILSTLIEFVKIKEKQTGLDSANIVFAGGLGLKTKENFEKLKTLTDKLNIGFGATRAAVDKGFAPQEAQIGQTGKTISPRLYVAFGISGANQHLAGINTAKTIVAINNDPNAPIFAQSDFKIVKDAVEIIDEMLEKVN